MKASSLWQISVTVPSEAEEPVAALFERIVGQPSSIYADAEDSRSRVTVFSATSPTSQIRVALIEGLKDLRSFGIETGTIRLDVKPVRREDWSESWKKHFKPIEVGSALLLKPSWSIRRPRRNQKVVILDPGLSFGTGQHPTTSFCLRALVDARRPAEAQSFLDVGTGSGILALAAAKIGYRPVRALDNDPVAVRIARANAMRNRVGHLLRITRSDLTRLSPVGRETFDVICANLIADLLISEAEKLCNRLKPGGRLMFAGVLAGQFAEVSKAFAKFGLRLVSSRLEGEWNSAAFVRPVKGSEAVD